MDNGLFKSGIKGLFIGNRGGARIPFRLQASAQLRNPGPAVARSEGGAFSNNAPTAARLDRPVFGQCLHQRVIHRRVGLEPPQPRVDAALCNNLAHPGCRVYLRQLPVEIPGVHVLAGIDLAQSVLIGQPHQAVGQQYIALGGVKLQRTVDQPLNL